MNAPKKSFFLYHFAAALGTGHLKNSHLPCGLEVIVVKRTELMYRRVIFEQTNC